MNFINQKNLNKLKEIIGYKRYKHSLGVVKTSLEFSKNYNIEKDKVILAALYHDCGKFLIKKEAYNFIEKYNLKFPKHILENFQLLHGPLGADVAKIYFNIDDEEILNAIKYHTTLRANPSDLEKIIYIADAIEPNRDYKGVKELREITYNSIVKGIYKSLDDTINNLEKKNLYIGKDSLEARKFFEKLI